MNYLFTLLPAANISTEGLKPRVAGKFGHPYEIKNVGDVKIGPYTYAGRSDTLMLLDNVKVLKN